MSEVRAGQIPYRGTPQVEPRFAPAEFQRIPTNPREFGAGIGAAEEKLGEGLQRTSDIYSEVAAQQANTNWQRGIRNILFGDPNNPGDVGYYGLHGQAAMEARASTLQRISDLTDQIRGGLGTARSQIMFNQEARYYQARLEGEIGMHYDNESRVWAQHVNNDQYQNAISDAALNYANDDAATHALATANQARVRGLQSQGLLPMDVSQATQEQRDMVGRETRESAIGIQEARIKAALGRNDLLTARRIFDANESLLSTSRNFDELSGQVQRHTKLYQASQLAFGSMPVAAATGGDNNPGNIRPVGATKGFNSYSSMDEGLKAISGNLLAYQDVHGLNTLSGIIGRWAPPSENDTGRLILNASARTGYAPDQPVNLHDPATLANVTHAIVMQEQGHLPAGVTLVSMRRIADQADAGGAQTTAADHAIPALAPQIDRIIRDGTAAGMDPEVISSALALTRERYNAQYTDEERARTLYRQAQQDASDKAENDITANLFSETPTITARQISQLPDLKPEARLRMLEFARKTLSPGSPEISRQETISLLSDIRRQPGDAARITDMGPIYDAFNQGRLTKEDFGFLQKQFTDFRGDDGQKLLTTENEFIKGMQSSITKSNPLMGQLDKEGDGQFYKFHWMVDHKIDEYRKAGKNPFDLFDPSKPEYLGSPSALRPYMTPLQQSMENISQGLLGNAPAPAAPAAAAPPSVAMRKPGESMTDWVARTHQGLPGASEPTTIQIPGGGTIAAPGTPQPFGMNTQGGGMVRDRQGNITDLPIREQPAEGTEGTPPEER